MHLVTEHARLLQHRAADGRRRVIYAEGEHAHFLSAVTTTLELATLAIKQDILLADAARALLTSEPVDIHVELESGQLLAAVDHPDPARVLLAGTGLTHLGSAEGRDAMHKAAASTDRPTDSMRMFLDGVAGGKPTLGVEGQQPEWFYKGDGATIVDPEADLVSPAFAEDGGEEPELAGIYLIDHEGIPRRLGIALANEFSDHVTERHNYLWLAHSKLRPASLGAELLLGTPPSDVRGFSRIRRSGKVAWEKPFLSGEDNMSHSLSNLEYHHFKYAPFRRPGDVHVHCFGTATLSFSDGFRTEVGDVFEIEAAPFALPLRNTLATTATADPIEVRKL